MLFKGFLIGPDKTRQDLDKTGQYNTGLDRIRTDRHTHAHTLTHTHMNVLYVMLSSSCVFFDFFWHSLALKGIAGVVQVRKNTLPQRPSIDWLRDWFDWLLDWLIWFDLIWFDVIWFDLMAATSRHHSLKFLKVFWSSGRRGHDLNIQTSKPCAF